MLVREPQLRATLRRLPGRKFVFSNAPVHYSRAVLKALGIADLFDGVFSIEHTRFRPKPDSTASCGCAGEPPEPALYHGRRHAREPAHGEEARHENGVGQPVGGRRAMSISRWRNLMQLRAHAWQFA